MNYNYFKLICGAGNKNLTEIRRLSTVYTLAGASAIDVSAHPESVKSAVVGINKANKLALEYDLPLPHFPVIVISVNAGDDDPHFRKAVINYNKCICCSVCIGVCNQDAIHMDESSGEISISLDKCIGCGKCIEACGVSGAIQFTYQNSVLSDIIPVCIQAGAEIIELHASTEDDEIVLAKWKVIADIIPQHKMSLCVDRSHLSDEHLIRRIYSAYELAGNRMIIQADGVPMSGGINDYHSTLQAIATADIILKSKIPVKVIVSGGTNSRTKDLADLCEVSIHGVAIGTFARNLVKPYINSDKFDTDPDIIMRAVSRAKGLIMKVTL